MNRFAKKIMSCIFAGVLFATCVFNLVGCKNEIKTSTDGTFKFFRLGDNQFYRGNKKDTYAIVGSCDELPEVLYIPAYHKGKEVSKIYYAHTVGIGLRGYGLSMEGVKTAYIPYTCNLDEGPYLDEPYARATTTFITCSIAAPNDNLITNVTHNYLRYLKENDTVYFTNAVYENIRISAESTPNSAFSIVETSGCVYVEHSGKMLKPANTAFMFNYENCPNGGYFFINDFEYGTTIENTPYEPIRDNYTFGGWYKESTCINAWNFETDTLLQTTYDDQGREFYQETKLYAKWIKE